jgi:hypothetical protein
LRSMSRASEPLNLIINHQSLSVIFY